ncbi:MAG: formate/nitrite transporter family protein [Oscillospiraceae bacterium]|nr:formate/nitrite transporter family protein [Oscillospiraceae bacterium]
MEMINKIISAVMCGIYISIGATAYIILGNNVAGALFFAAGILLVSAYYNMLLTRVFALYAFKDSGYKPSDVLIAFCGNFIGCIAYAAVISVTRVGNAVQKETIERIVDLRLNDSYLSIFILAVLCGFLVASACLTSKVFENRGVALALTVVFIATFVICVPEHIVADMFYFAYYSINIGLKVEFIPIIIIVTLGNLTGGMGMSYLERYRAAK